VAGLVANAGPAPKVRPHYTGLKGQSVGVTVWASRATRIDFPELQLEVARGVQKKLQDAQKDAAEELKGTTFPPNKNPDTLWKWQQDNPALMLEPITEIAPRLGLGRLIYIEVDDYSLRSGIVEELWRGTLSARVQVIEVDGGKARSAFDERVSVVFPRNAPEEGLPNYSEMVMKVGTLDAFTTAVLQKFVTYEEQR
jgi:hypothetical protein